MKTLTTEPKGEPKPLKPKEKEGKLGKSVEEPRPLQKSAEEGTKPKGTKKRLRKPKTKKAEPAAGEGQRVLEERPVGAIPTAIEMSRGEEPPTVVVAPPPVIQDPIKERKELVDKMSKEVRY